MAAIELAKLPKRTTRYRWRSQARSADDWAWSRDKRQSLLPPDVILRRAASHHKTRDGAFDAHSPPRYRHVPLQKRLEKPNRSRVTQKYASNRADVRNGSKADLPLFSGDVRFAPERSHPVDVPGARLAFRTARENAEAPHGVGLMRARHNEARLDGRLSC
jgi:hypothetical protein